MIRRWKGWPRAPLLSLRVFGSCDKSPILAARGLPMRFVVVASIVLFVLVIGVTLVYAQDSADTPTGVSFTAGWKGADPYIEGVWDTPPDDVVVWIQVRSSLRIGVTHGLRNADKLVESGCSVSETSARFSTKCLRRYYQQGAKPGFQSMHYRQQMSAWAGSSFIVSGRTYTYKLVFTRSGEDVGESPPMQVTVPEYVYPTPTPRPTETPWPTWTPTPTSEPTPTSMPKPVQVTPCPPAIPVAPQDIPTPTPIPLPQTTSLAELFRENVDLWGVWEFNNASKSWEMARWDGVGELRELERGKPYYFVVSESTWVGEHYLTCNEDVAWENGSCTNVVAW